MKGGIEGKKTAVTFCIDSIKCILKIIIHVPAYIYTPTDFICITINVNILIVLNT